MNYYEHHIGDYAQATAHLTFVEDAAYNRLLRKYYAEERPIPADLKAAQRLVAARTREEREAVETVLSEFFTLEADGWHNKRADAEIERYSTKRDKARRSAEARWTGSEGKAKAKRTDSERNANASAKHGKRNALQSPDTKQEQEPPIPPSGGLLGDEGEGESPARRAASGKITFATFIAECRAAREKPIPPGHSVFAFARDTGIPVEYIRLAWREFARKYRDDAGKQKGRAGWRKKFDNCVRGNWYRLWWTNTEGACELTTTGRLLQKELDAEAARQEDQAA